MNLVNYFHGTTMCKGKEKLRKGGSSSEVYLSVISILLSKES